jgi:hypothetical protein
VVEHVLVGYHAVVGCYEAMAVLGCYEAMAVIGCHEALAEHAVVECALHVVNICPIAYSCINGC